VQNGDKAVDAVDVEATWNGLTSSPRSQLVDVRTRAEWTYVGIPDLEPIGKRAVLVEWQTFGKNSRRICTLFHAALSGTVHANQSSTIPGHNGPTGHPSSQSGAAGKVALFRCRDRSSSFE
jgi:hypothetical protein